MWDSVWLGGKDGQKAVDGLERKHGGEEARMGGGGGDDKADNKWTEKMHVEKD